MESLFIEQTKSTPEVRFDISKHVLALQGQSYPENAFKFYEPIFAWVDRYLSVSGAEETGILLNLPYINTSSAKCVMMLLDRFNDAFLQGKRIYIQWYCREDNESEIECAEEFKEDLELPFDIIFLPED
ncbi:DUF1987 domain-containing protein [Paenibacillus thalictri]|uniref:DUF1987 domain-containing protein n=1 Tax=Paenibacillus thalictri TaxID=2527873 RepID=A0A4Q9E1T2_9BACL|nr:DUF1987 domain-containing protein [Paenibacillus thalictri]TBL81551.1 DUF1987 domain-containing protein [Paenibacillus thalictri]